MKGDWFQHFSQQFLLPEMPGFTAKGKFLLKSPVGAMVRGFVFDSSGFSKESFYPQVYVQPLYVPSFHVTLTLGERFKGNWQVIQGEERKLGAKLVENIRSIGMPFLKALDGPEKLAHPPPRWKESPNVHVQQAIAYSLAYVGEDRPAMELIEKTCNHIQAGGDKRDWVLKLLEALQNFKTLLRKDPMKARGLLAEWTEETREHLRLPE